MDYGVYYYDYYYKLRRCSNENCAICLLSLRLHFEAQQAATNDQASIRTIDDIALIPLQGDPALKSVPQEQPEKAAEWAREVLSNVLTNSRGNKLHS
jgi:hypothetical protein